jgi:hypothetical protein
MTTMALRTMRIPTMAMAEETIAVVSVKTKAAADWLLY